VTAFGPITPNEHFYITSCCENSPVDASAWALSIKNRGVEIASIDYATLTGLPARDKEHTLECIGASPYYLSISNAIWTGLPLTEVFEAAHVAVSPGTIEPIYRAHLRTPSPCLPDAIPRGPALAHDAPVLGRPIVPRAAPRAVQPALAVAQLTGRHRATKAGAMGKSCP
jgi:hypothetical protein